MFPNVPIMALTATATNQVLKDTIHLLGITPRIYTKSYFRKNLNIIVKQRNDSSIQDIVNTINSKYSDVTGIMYCISRKKCEELSQKLNIMGIECAAYHAGLSDKKRTTIQQLWQEGVYKVIIATVAFGMGIDKPDVRYVIHYNLPNSIENYYQEIGRAGRDGKPSDCILYFSYQDKIISEKLLKKDQKSKNEKYIEHQMSKLNQMINYANNISECRHCQISNYLGELRQFTQQSCINSCDNCKDVNIIEKKDVTDICILIFNAIISGNITKNNIKLGFIRSNDFTKLVDQYGSKKNLFTLYDRVFINLLSESYINETLHTKKWVLD